MISQHNCLGPLQKLQDMLMLLHLNYWISITRERGGCWFHLLMSNTWTSTIFTLKLNHSVESQRHCEGACRSFHQEFHIIFVPSNVYLRKLAQGILGLQHVLNVLGRNDLGKWFFKWERCKCWCFFCFKHPTCLVDLCWS